MFNKKISVYVLMEGGGEKLAFLWALTLKTMIKQGTHKMTFRSQGVISLFLV